MKSILMFWFLILPHASIAASTTSVTTPTALNLPQRTDHLKYKTIFENSPLRQRNAMVYLGAHLGLKNGSGTDLNYCKALRDFFCVGINGFIGTLSSKNLVRPVIENTIPGSGTTETPPATTEYDDILDSPESWTAFVPQVQFSAFGPLIFTNDDRWSDSATIAIGPAYIGGRSGWAVSFEPAIHRQFKTMGNWGFSLKTKYTFGWLNPKNNGYGTIPFDWFNLSAGVHYLW
jgi:hypothetical protein